MRARLFLALVLAAAASGQACAPQTTPQDRCAEVKRQLVTCVGNVADRLDCSQMTDTDIDRLSAATTSTSCALLEDALPIDGDPQSATCRLMDVGCIAAVTPAPTFGAAKYPIVLVNGIDSSPLFRYSDRIVRTMTGAGGHQVFLATLPAYETPQIRAPLLLQRIVDVRRQTGAGKVNLVCHSLGGLDCRYLVSPGGLVADTGVEAASSVASITTVATAHRGTRVADVLLDLTPDDDRGQVVNDFASLVGDWFSDQALQQDAHLRDAIRALSTPQAAAFNAEIVDAPGIYYQSWAGYSRPFGQSTPDLDARLRELCAPTDKEDGDGLPGFGAADYMALPLVPFADVIGKETANAVMPNDGLAGVASTRWGRFRGCVPADHMEQLGQRSIPDVNVRTGFDVARFYANVAGDLRARGF
jgi:triacylglycerol lipase